MASDVPINTLETSKRSRTTRQRQQGISAGRQVNLVFLTAFASQFKQGVGFGVVFPDFARHALVAWGALSSFPS